MIKLTSFIVLTHFFQFNQLKILSFKFNIFKLNQQIFFYSVLEHGKYWKSPWNVVHHGKSCKNMVYSIYDLSG